MTQLLRRLHYLLNRRRLEEELAGEMEFHREMAGHENGARFGNALRLREEARDAWGWTWIDRLVQDLSYAARVLRKSPGFTLAAVLMLAIGIGANVALFGFLDLMMLRPLNVHEPDTLLRFHRHSPEQYAYALPYAEVAFFREHSKTLSAVLAVSPSRVSIEQERKQVAAHFVSANYFQELGAAAGLGRVFDPARDEAASADAVVVLSHAFCQRQFGADPALIGRTIRLNDKPATVIGIAPLGFGGLSLEEPAVWVPITQEPRLVNGSRLLTDFAVENSSVQMFGRLQRGLTPQVAEEELRSLAAELRRQYPDAVWDNESLPSEPGGYAKGLRFGGKRGTGSEGRDELYPMLAIAGALVLLILTVACANLGSLLLARGVARQQEISIRIAIGAGTGRLIRQLLTESLLLALLGSAAGVFVGYLVLRSLMQLSEAPAWLDPTPDWRVLLFALGAGLVTVTLFGLMPAIQVARQRYRAGLTRQILVGVQVASSCVLLIVAGLLGRALNHAVSTHPGFEYGQVLSIDPGLSCHGYSTENARAYLETLQSRLRALPGIESVSLALTPPLGRKTISARVEIDGRPVPVQMNRVDPQFLETMRIPLLRGRNLQRGSTREAVISESLARTVWPAQDPLGKTFPLGEGYTIVGIAGAARRKAFPCAIRLGAPVHLAGRCRNARGHRSGHCHIPSSSERTLRSQPPGSPYLPRHDRVFSLHHNARSSGACKTGAAHRSFKGASSRVADPTSAASVPPKARDRHCGRIQCRGVTAQPVLQSTIPAPLLPVITAAPLSGPSLPAQSAEIPYPVKA